MTDYVISYDICALMLMSVFLTYYYASKRFQNEGNRRFSMLAMHVLLSIIFDILGVAVITYKDVCPIWLIYLVNILYFVITGFMSVAFCLYTMTETQAIIGKKTKKFMTIFFIPYTVAFLIISTTPLTHLVFYVDEEHTYLQGPMMGILLIVIFAYLIFSIVRITFYTDNGNYRKKFPYYAFALLMIISIIIQYSTTKYLMYGIAEALGILVIFITNHNPNDMIDIDTQLFNRKALVAGLDEVLEKNEECFAVGFGVKESGKEYEDNIFKEIIYSQIGNFLNDNFDSRKCFSIDNGCFAVLCNSKSEADDAVYRIKLRFSEPWKLHAGKFNIYIGMSMVHFPNDVKRSVSVYDMLHKGIYYSNRSGGHLIDINGIRDERERMIRSLENEQKVLEEKYQQADIQMQQAVQADKSKSLFLAQMSHEIRTPMTAILGMTELLLRDTKDSKVIEHANGIMTSGKTLIGIINDILDFSKIEAGKLEILEENYYMQSVVNDVVSSIEQRVSEKRLNFRVHYNPHIPAVMYGDEIRIKQIMTNLLTNACKYTEKGTVEFDIDAVNTSEDRTEIVISVKDTGIGIKEENISKLFDGFERFDSQKNKAIEGTGLGLAICKMLVERMNGSIEVKSEYGIGSTFSVHIPQKVINPDDSIKVEGAGKYRFLVVCNQTISKEDFAPCFDDLDISVEYVCTQKELDVIYNLPRAGLFTHIIVSYSDFERLKSENSAIAKDTRLVIALYYRQYMVDLTGYQVIHMPVSSINISELLSGAKQVENTNLVTKFESFAAPDARLLVVDDNLVNLKIFTGLLDCHSMKIDCADSGDKAIAFAKEQKYDIIFLDHMMPKKDGIETLHEMKAVPGFVNAQTPVIAFTANAISGMREMFLEQGFSDFLSKPINISKLETILREYLPADKILAVSNDAGPDTDFEIDGIDMEQALYYSGGSYETLKSVLEVFVSDGKSKLPLIKEYAEKREYNAYRIEIHAVKSLCKGIGADELSEKARLLEQACKDEEYDYVNDNCLEAYTEYSKLIDTIDNSLKEYKASQKKENKAQTESVLEYKEQLTCILALLHEFEEDISLKLTEDLLSRDLPEDVKKSVEEIKSKLDLFDYDGAADMISEVIDEN